MAERTLDCAACGRARRGCGGRDGRSDRPPPARVSSRSASSSAAIRSAIRSPDDWRSARAEPKPKSKWKRRPQAARGVDTVRPRSESQSSGNVETKARRPAAARHGDRQADVAAGVGGHSGFGASALRGAAVLTGSFVADARGRAWDFAMRKFTSGSGRIGSAGGRRPEIDRSGAVRGRLDGRGGGRRCDRLSGARSRHRLIHAGNSNDGGAHGRLAGRARGNRPGASMLGMRIPQAGAAGASASETSFGRRLGLRLCPARAACHKLGKLGDQVVGFILAIRHLLWSRCHRKAAPSNRPLDARLDPRRA